MSKLIDQEAYNEALTEKYRAMIPADLHDILCPEPDRLEELALAIKRLRVREEERYYVMEIQRRYRLPLRPNESVKRSMIRARLAIVNKRRETGEDESLIDIHGPLPTDPLE